MKKKIQKPPLGVMPKYIWLEKRMMELTRAIYEYSLLPSQWPIINTWIKELENRLDEYLNLKPNLTTNLTTDYYNIVGIAEEDLKCGNAVTMKNKKISKI